VQQPARRRPLRTLTQGTAVLVTVVLVASGIAAGGLLGAFFGLGIAALVVGAGALVVGHARWARIGGRRTAGIVVVVGVIALAVGGTAMPSQKATTAGGSGVSNVAAAGLLDDATTTTAVDSALASSPTSALAALRSIPVKGRAPMTGYSRGQFGSGWVDADHNGCDTRNDVLARDLTGETVKPGTHNCVVLTGSLADPYSGRAIAFQRGVRTSSAVQIDHVVALGDAWQTGAQGLSAATRTAFANDPRNLLAVDGPLNEQKGDGDAATWLPPNKAYRCAYVARQVAVKVAYGLWMTQAEKDASATVLSACPGTALPDGVVAVVPAPTTSAAPVATRAPATTRAPAPRTTVVPAPVPAPVGGSVSYANCTAVRAAGAAPIHLGEPGYRPALDRDGDGIGCEN
jgi:hypothetical protein